MGENYGLGDLYMGGEVKQRLVPGRFTSQDDPSPFPPASVLLSMNPFRLRTELVIVAADGRRLPTQLRRPCRGL